ncbi:hypothetical protein [Dickeya zeae]|uniref:hypothetical protein n=1 Tax=Dickeya zeae TaxID=204042 RepID=UPI000370C848|nr:hypothetical protein [Dickeya zeae]UJR52635.1 hypothetical protein J417_00280 [Dickeya zeae MS1]UJR63617.1 hypothetical protein HJ586_16260 [Dickeya zeae]
MRLLFICPDWANLATPIVTEMKRQGHDVTHIDHCDLSTFHYFDSPHRIVSKIYKTITGKNYKRLVLDNQIKLGLHNFFIGREPFDAIIMTEPKLFNEQHLAILRQHARKLVATLWDGLKKAPANGLYLNQFDHVLSFDSEDCEQFHFTKITNYIDSAWKSSIPYQACEYDIFSVMSFTPERYRHVIHFLDKNPGLKSNIIFYIGDSGKPKCIKDNRIKTSEKLLLGTELAHEISNSRAILDILQGQQTGLSFRAYESMAYQRKLITTNSHITSYDFYNPQNICVLDQDGYLPQGFIHTPYQPVPEPIYHQYTLCSWVEKVIQEISDNISPV